MARLKKNRFDENKVLERAVNLFCRKDKSGTAIAADLQSSIEQNTKSLKSFNLRFLTFPDSGEQESYLYTLRRNWQFV